MSFLVFGWLLGTGLVLSSDLFPSRNGRHAFSVLLEAMMTRSYWAAVRDNGRERRLVTSVLFISHNMSLRYFFLFLYDAATRTFFRPAIFPFGSSSALHCFSRLCSKKRGIAILYKTQTCCLLLQNALPCTKRRSMQTDASRR